MIVTWLVGGVQGVAALTAVSAVDTRAVDTVATPADEVQRGSDITVTATRQPRRVDEVPATVTVITEQRMADEMATDVRDLVRFEPGVTVPRSPVRFGAALGATGRDGNSGFRIRGIGGNRVLIQVDGVRVPDGFAFGAQNAGRGDYVDLGIVRSVEILRGPSSALYGSDGLAGVVSFQTSDPADLLGTDRDGMVMGRVGYDSASDEISATAIAAGRSGPWQALVTFTRRDGHELDNQGTNVTATSARTAPNPQETTSEAALGRIVYDPGNGHRFRLTTEHARGTVTTDVLSGRSATVLGVFGTDRIERSRVALDWRYAAPSAQAFVQAAQITAYWQSADNSQFTYEDRTPAVDRTRLNTFDNAVIGFSGDVRAGFSTGSIRHSLILGGDLSFTHQEGVRGGTVPPAGETFPTRAFPETDFTLGGLFLTDEISIADGLLTLNPALRFDYYDLSPANDPLLPAFAGSGQDGSRITPRIGAVLRIGGGFSVYGNYAQGFKAPAPGQVNQFFSNLAQGYTSLPNPNLRPETSETFEAGIRFARGVFSSSLTAFTGSYDDFISQQVVSGSFTPADPAVYQFINLSDVKIEGIEGRAALAFPFGLTADLAFAYAEGDVGNGTGVRTPLVSIDPFRLVGGLGYRDPAGRFGGNLHVTWTARKELADTTGLCTPSCFRPDESTVLDITAFWRPTEHITLRIGIFNLTDETYAYWGDVAGLGSTSTIADAYTQPGRNARVSATFNF